MHVYSTPVGRTAISSLQWLHALRLHFNCACQMTCCVLCLQIESYHSCVKQKTNAQQLEKRGQGDKEEEVSCYVNATPFIQHIYHMVELTGAG